MITESLRGESKSERGYQGEKTKRQVKTIEEIKKDYGEVSS